MLKSTKISVVYAEKNQYKVNRNKNPGRKRKKSWQKNSRRKAVRYEIAMPKGKKIEDLGKPGAFTFFGVDTGLACIADGKVSEENRLFFDKRTGENPGKNKYTDYFAALFQESFEANPEFQNQGGSFLEWSLPGSGLRTVLFSSGMGDGIYSGYWGLDAEGEIACLVALFMNPEYF